MSLSAAAVLAAAATWVYVPPGAREVRTGEFRLVAYPETWPNPTHVLSLDAAGPAEALVDDVLAAARELGRPDVLFRVTPATRPADLVEHLRARGSTLVEELAVLARPLDGLGDLPDLPDLDVPDDTEIRPALDLATLRDADRVGVEVFGGRPGSEEELAALAHGDVARGISFVGYREDIPIATAGCTVRDGAARMWGGSVLAEARGTGAYRALLDHRLRFAVAHGAPMALVKGRLETSAPILRRAGFAAYGEERAHRLGVDA